MWLKRLRILSGGHAVMPCQQRKSLWGELSLLTQFMTVAVLLLKTLCMLCGLAQRLTSCGLISPCRISAGLRISITSKCWCHGWLRKGSSWNSLHTQPGLYGTNVTKSGWEPLPLRLIRFQVSHEPCCTSSILGLWFPTLIYTVELTVCSNVGCLLQRILSK